MIRSAEFSDCGKYRYLLSRDWDLDKPVAMCIGLNPSKADNEKDDATIRILTKSLKLLGFGGLRMCNLYAWISTNPKNLFEVPDSLGMNDEWLESTAYGVQEIIFCWGSFKNTEYRQKKVIQMFPDAVCFGRNKDGSPSHPMNLMYAGVKDEDLKLIRWEQPKVKS